MPELLDLPPVPPDTPAVDIITSLGFNPATVRAVVVTTESVIGVSAQIPDPITLPELP